MATGRSIGMTLLGVAGIILLALGIGSAAAQTTSEGTTTATETAGGTTAAPAATTAAAGSADSAGETTEADSQGPVSFLDERPLKISLDRLKADGGLRVLVRNNLARTQPIELRVVGLVQAEDTEARGILPPGPVGDEFLAAETKALKIRLGKSENVETGSYPALLVASGDSGPPVRRELTIEVADPDAAPRGTALSADDISAVTVGATNYLPSLLAPWSAALVGAALLGFSVIWAAWSLFSKPRWRALAGFACLFTAIVGGVFLFKRDLSEPDSLHAISVRPVPVFSVGDGTVGVAQNGSGRVARLEILAGKLKPQGLTSAGVFKGKVDLTAGVDGGDADATINVRDWWPWAFLTIGLGLGLAYWLRRWFQYRRQEAQLGRRVLRIYFELGLSDIAFDRQTAGAFPKLHLRRRLETKQKVYDGQVERGELEEAAKTLAALDSYVAAFAALRGDVVELTSIVDQILADFRKESFGLSDEIRIVVKQKFDQLARAGFDDLSEDAEMKAIGEYRKVVAPLISLAREVNRLQTLTVADLSRARSCAHGRSGVDTLIKGLTKLGEEILREGDVSKLPALAEREEDLWEKLKELCPTADRVAEAGPDEIAALRLRGPGRAALHAFVREVLPDGELAMEPTGKVELSWQATAPNHSQEAAPDDLVLVRIAFPDTNLNYREVEVDFGDGAPALVRAVPVVLPRVIEVPVRFAAVGRYEIEVSTYADKRSLAKRAITVRGERRLDSLSASLARTDRALLRIAFVLAVGSGLAALYFTDAGWGEPEDYLAALLWGGAVGEGTVLAAGLATRLTSSTSSK